MTLTELYKIDGKPLPAPDAGVVMSFEDLDAAESGRDEAGFMHRIVVRQKVGVWEFTYSHLTSREYAYLLSVLPTGGSFRFSRPAPGDEARQQESLCYLSGYSLAWYSAATGQYRDMKFSIIEC